MVGPTQSPADMVCRWGELVLCRGIDSTNLKFRTWIWRPGHIKAGYAQMTDFRLEPLGPAIVSIIKCDRDWATRGHMIMAQTLYIYNTSPRTFRRPM
jgi:hypothetical protein